MTHSPEQVPPRSPIDVRAIVASIQARAGTTAPERVGDQPVTFRPQIGASTRGRRGWFVDRARLVLAKLEYPLHQDFSTQVNQQLARRATSDEVNRLADRIADLEDRIRRLEK